MNLGENRTKTALACPWNVANFLGMVGTGIRGVAETTGFPAVHYLPDVVGNRRRDEMAHGQENLAPMVFEDLFEIEAAFADGFHDGLGL